MKVLRRKNEKGESSSFFTDFYYARINIDGKERAFKREEIKAN